MVLTKKVYSKTKKIFIAGSGTFLAFFTLLLSLSYLGVNVTTSGDQVCSDTCISYFNISLTNYSLCFGSTFKGVYFDKEVPYELYKADLRYRSDNPNRWKLFNFTANKCLDKNKIHEFKLVGHKDPYTSIKWGVDMTDIGKDIDPFWYSISGTPNISTSSLTMELGSKVNITANLTGYSGTVCVDIDHPSYNNSYSCGTPSANFLFNISYFRNNQFYASVYNYSNCYQETANVSTACGGLNTGIYSTSFGTFYINYTKPSNSTSSSLWQIKYGNINENVSLGEDCWNYNNNIIILRMTTGCLSNNVAAASCYNGSSWKSLSQSLSSGTGVCDQFGGGNIANSVYLYDENWSYGVYDQGSTYSLEKWVPSEVNLYNKTLFEEAMNWNISSLLPSPTLVSSNNITFIDGGNNTNYIKQHQYDEIINASLNVTGFLNDGTYPNNVKIYINNTLSNDLGNIFSGTNTLNKLNDSSTIKNLTFNLSSTNTVYFNIPKIVSVSSAYINFSGFNSTVFNCYQETANKSNSNDGGYYCGLNYSGYYNSSNNIINITYIKPQNSNGAKWRFRHSNLNEMNVSVPLDCWNADSSLITFSMTNTLDTSWTNQAYFNASCWNGTRFVVLNTSLCYPISPESTVTNNRYIYDEIWTNGAIYSNFLSSWHRVDTSEGTWCGIFEEGIYWNSTHYPLNVSMEIGSSDGVKEWNYTNYFNVTNNKTSNINTSFNEALSTCIVNSYGYCIIPMYLTSLSPGIIQISDMQINYSYNPNPVYLNTNLISSFLGNSTNFANIPIKFESSQNGTLAIDDIRLDYRGGNKTVNILVYDANATVDCYQETANVSNVNDDSCDLNYSGIYNFTGDNFIINYSKPPNSVGAKWKVKHSNLLAYNQTIPSSCWNAYSNILSVRFRSYSLASEIGCYNGTDWEQLNISSQAASAASNTECGLNNRMYDGDWDTWQFYDVAPGGCGDSPWYNVWSSYNFVGAYAWFVYEDAMIWSISGNINKTYNETINVTVFYSDWDYNFPYRVNYLEFIPKTSNSKNVTPYGQTSLTPIFNITTYNYGGRNANLSIYLNESVSCVNLTYSTNNNKSNGTLLTNQTWFNVFTNKSYLSNQGIFLWADYSCNYSYWKIFQPEIYLKSCCWNCTVCSEDITD